MLMPLVDKALSGLSRDKIVEQLEEVGFDHELQRQLVGSLSGGWKMRRELARAMLYDAELLILHERRSHVRRLFSCPGSAAHDDCRWTLNLSNGLRIILLPGRTLLALLSLTTQGECFAFLLVHY